MRSDAAAPGLRLLVRAPLALRPGRRASPEPAVRRARGGAGPGWGGAAAPRKLWATERARGSPVARDGGGEAARPGSPSAPGHPPGDPRAASARAPGPEAWQPRRLPGAIAHPGSPAGVPGALSALGEAVLETPFVECNSFH